MAFSALGDFKLCGFHLLKVKRIPAIEKNYAVQTSGKRGYIDFIASEILQFYALFCVQIWTCFSIKIKLRLFCEKKEKKRKKKIHTKNILDPILAFKDFTDCVFFRIGIPKDS